MVPWNRFVNNGGRLGNKAAGFLVSVVMMSNLSAAQGGGAASVIDLQAISQNLKPQTAPTQAPSDSQAPVVITLRDALQRARNLDPTYRAALVAAGIAREDHLQARAALLPGVTENTQYLYTQGTGTSTPRYIANNGVHEYIAQGNAHEVISGAQFADFSRTSATAAAARANAEVAARGLVAAVVKTYYAEVVARRKYANAQLAADQARLFFELTQKLEQGGEVAHSDVIKAQLTTNDAQRALREAQLEMDRTHLELAVLV